MGLRSPAVSLGSEVAPLARVSRSLSASCCLLGGNARTLSISWSSRFAAMIFLHFAKQLAAQSCRGNCNVRWARGRSDAYRRAVGTWRIGKLLPGALSPCRYVPQAWQDGRGSGLL